MATVKPIKATFTINTRGMTWRLKMVGLMLKLDCWLMKLRCKLNGDIHVRYEITVNIEKHDDGDGGV